MSDCHLLIMVLDSQESPPSEELLSNGPVKTEHNVIQSISDRATYFGGI